MNTSRVEVERVSNYQLYTHRTSHSAHIAQKYIICCIKRVSFIKWKWSNSIKRWKDEIMNQDERERHIVYLNWLKWAIMPYACMHMRDVCTVWLYNIDRSLCKYILKVYIKLSLKNKKNNTKNFRLHFSESKWIPNFNAAKIIFL